MTSACPGSSFSEYTTSWTLPASRRTTLTVASTMKTVVQFRRPPHSPLRTAARHRIPLRPPWVRATPSDPSDLDDGRLLLPLAPPEQVHGADDEDGGHPGDGHGHRLGRGGGRVDLAADLPQLRFDVAAAHRLGR